MANSVSSVEPARPPITARASGRFISSPGFRWIAIGSRPTTVASVVIRIEAELPGDVPADCPPRLGEVAGQPLAEALVLGQLLVVGRQVAQGVFQRRLADEPLDLGGDAGQVVAGHVEEELADPAGVAV